MNVDRILADVLGKNSEAYDIVRTHGQHVAHKALHIATTHFINEVDMQLIEEASMLHDIGVAYVDAPHIGCHGEQRYLAHGQIGHDILQELGLPKHALICDRHVGVGLTRHEIEIAHLPLEPRDCVPITLEEEIVCYADLFYSKNKKKLHVEKDIKKIRKKAHHWSKRSVIHLDEMIHKFGV